MQHIYEPAFQVGAQLGLHIGRQSMAVATGRRDNGRQCPQIDPSIDRVVSASQNPRKVATKLSPTVTCSSGRPPHLFRRLDAVLTRGPVPADQTRCKKPVRISLSESGEKGILFRYPLKNREN